MQRMEVMLDDGVWSMLISGGLGRVCWSGQQELKNKHKCGPWWQKMKDLNSSFSKPLISLDSQLEGTPPKVPKRQTILESPPEQRLATLHLKYPGLDTIDNQAAPLPHFKASIASDRHQRYIYKMNKLTFPDCLSFSPNMVTVSTRISRYLNK